MSVSARFTSFLSNLKLTDDQKAKGGERREAVVRAMNSQYWGVSNGTANSLYVGSWAKQTRIRPPRDVDVLFNLPNAVYERFQGRTGNRQSQLLQEVKLILLKSFPNTAIRGDGPVVVVPFSAYNVELVPAFPLTGGGHWVCMTDNGGHYKKADYAAEVNAISASNANSANNTRDLVRMMKRWQAECSVPLKSFHIELLVIDFINQWGYRGKGAVYYDWMVRDFLHYIIGRAEGYVFAPGTMEVMALGSSWKSRAETAYARALKACGYEAASDWGNAGDEWQKIFGIDIPKWP
jgi:hypothetical protein